MKPRARYQENAAECEREAVRATAPALKVKYRDLARQWREVPEQKSGRR
jgi:hypothetical protein